MSEGKRNAVYSFLGRRWVRKDIFEKALKDGSNNWQPIETAPRDGTQVLLFDPDYPSKIACASFEVCEQFSPWVERGIDYATEVWGRGEMKPTHWMPLPKAPE